MRTPPRPLATRVTASGVAVLGAVLLSTSALATPPAVSLVRGDLLVTDTHQAQVVRVNHVSGSVAVFSPREGQANLLSFPEAIAVDASGYIYVVNVVLNQGATQLVVIDPYTGEQSAAQVCDPFCHDLDIPTATGLAMTYSSPGFSSLLEISWSGLFALTRSSVSQWTSTQVSGLEVMGQLYGMITPSAIAYSAQHTTAYVPDGDNLNEEDVSNPGIFTQIVNTGGPQIGGVAYESNLNQVFFTQWDGDTQGCDASKSGLRHYSGGQVLDDSLGGLLRCPAAVVEGDPRQAGNPFYVLDFASMFSRPADPQIVVVVTDGFPGAPQSQLVDFATSEVTGVIPNGMAISPVDFVPEPGGRSLAASAFAALLALAAPLRRPARAARTRHSVGLLVAGAVLIAAPPRAHAAPYALAQGDVLIADFDGDRLLRVDHVSGAVEVFSPRQGQANLFDQVSDVVIDPDGAIYATNYHTNQLIQVDPQTGAQSVVRSCVFVAGHFDCADVATGLGPTGIAIVPDQSALASTFYVSAYDGVHQITRSAVLLSGWGSALLVGAGALLPLQAIAYDPATALVHVLDGFGGIDDVDPANPIALVPELGPDAGEEFGGVAALGGDVYFTVRKPTGDHFSCFETPFGVGDFHQIQDQRFQLETGYASHCSGPLALAPDGDTLWFVDQIEIEGRFRVLRMTLSDPLRVASVVADVAASQPPSWPRGIAVSPVDFAPEPASGLEEAAALFALACAGRRVGRERTSA